MGKQPTALVRFGMPSTADLIFVALLYVVVFTPLSVRLLGDAGIGWHIRAGQQILATHTIPRVDPFSSTMSGKPWFAWEWLYDLVVGQLEATLGLNGVVWLTALAIATAFAWTFHLLILRGTNLLIALVLVLLAASASTIHFLARPHVMSWLLTVAWFWILDSSEQLSISQAHQRGRRIWALPPLMLIWVNVHGGFVIGFVLLGIFCLGARWRWWRAKEGRIEEVLQKITARTQARNLAWVGVLSAAASLVNPYGWRLHAHVHSYLTNRFLMDHIDEFQSPNFHGLAQRCFLLLLLIAVGVLMARGRELRISEGLTVLFALYAGLYASRNIPMSAILLVLVVGPLVPKLGLGRGGFFQRMNAVELKMQGHVWPILAVVLSFVVAAIGGRIGTSRLMDAHFDASRMPVEAVNYLQKHEIRGPILSPDYWGGYLIYRLYPETLVVVDDRHDLYGDKVLQSYLKAIRGERGWDEFLRQHDVTYVLVPRDAALANILIVSKGWKTIYTDEVGIVLATDSVTQSMRAPLNAAGSSN